jgi:hypothetical protein
VRRITGNSNVFSRSLTASRPELDQFLDGNLEPVPDVEDVPWVTGGAGGIPDGACTVFPPGAGSGIVFRG